MHASVTAERFRAMHGFHRRLSTNEGKSKNEANVAWGAVGTCKSSKYYRLLTMTESKRKKAFEMILKRRARITKQFWHDRHRTVG